LDTLWSIFKVGYFGIYTHYPLDVTALGYSYSWYYYFLILRLGIPGPRIRHSWPWIQGSGWTFHSWSILGLGSGILQGFNLFFQVWLGTSGFKFRRLNVILGILGTCVSRNSSEVSLFFPGYWGFRILLAIFLGSVWNFQEISGKLTLVPFGPFLGGFDFQGMLRNP